MVDLALLQRRGFFIYRGVWSRVESGAAQTVLRADQAMEPTLRIKVTMTDGTVIEIEQELPDARLLLHRMPNGGSRDPGSGRFHPADSIHTIEVMPPPEPLRFSDN